MRLHPRWDAASRLVVTNAVSLVGTTVVTSVLGYLYWSLAARLFPPPVVGLAAAAVSAMSLLATLGLLGLGTVLIGELSRQPGHERALVTAAMVVAGGVATGLGVAFALLSPRLSDELAVLAAGPATIALFACGVGLTSTALLMDQAVIGLSRGGAQFWRNAVFASSKLGLLVLAGLWAAGASGLLIYATWLGGILVSFLSLGVWLASGQGLSITGWPRFGLLRRLGPVALRHYALNVALQAPALALPVLVAALLSTTASAYFYVAWMVAGLSFVGPAALGTALYAAGAREPAALPRRLRFTLKLGLAGGLASSAALLLGAELLLALFGRSYAAEAAGSVRILALGVFPLLLKNSYVAICRVQERLTRAAVFVAAGGVLELLLAALGGSWAGLPGLTLAWLLALVVQAGGVASVVWRAAGADRRPTRPESVQTDDRTRRETGRYLVREGIHS